MKKFCFTILWTVFALLVAGFLSGVTIFIMAFAGMDTDKSSASSLVRWSIVAVLFTITVVLGFLGKLPGTRQGRIG